MVIGIPLVAPGQLKFRVELDGRHFASHIITVRRLDKLPPGLELLPDESGIDRGDKDGNDQAYASN
jgi:hypothetical protein